MAMRPLRSLLSFEEALKVCLEKTEPIERRESVPLAEAGGRVLCEDITASSDVPAFDRAAMDGYAVLAQDTYQAGTLKPAALEVIETLYAGDLAKKKVGPGTCTRPRPRHASPRRDRGGAGSGSSRAHPAPQRAARDRHRGC